MGERKSDITRRHHATRGALGECKRCTASIPVNFPAMADSGGVNNMGAVINAVKDAIISDPNTPERIVTLQFLATGRPWIGCKRVNF